MPVAQHMRLGRGHLAQGGECLLGAALLHDAQDGVEYDDQQDRACLVPLTQRAGDNRRADEQQYGHILELTQKPLQEAGPGLFS